MTYKNGNFPTQIHIWVKPKNVKDLDDLVDADEYGSNRSRIVRELIEKAWHEKFDAIYEAREKQQSE
jgi:hypothetical protein